MMRIKFYLLFFFVVGIFNAGFAQGWVLEFGVYYSAEGNPPYTPCKFGNYEFKVGTSTSGSMYLFGQNGAVNDHYYLRGTDWDNLTDKTITINLNTVSCSNSNSNVSLGGNDNASDNINSNSNICYNLGINPTGTISMKYSSSGSSSYDFKMGYIFWPRLVIDTARSCDAITLSAPRCLKGTAKWEVSNTSAGGWKTVSNTSKQITLTASDLSALGLSSVYGVLYARVSDSGLAGRTSAAQAFNVYAPPPTVSIADSTDAICKGESNGTVTLQISNAASAVNRFYINCTHADGSLKIEPVVYPGTYQIKDLKAGDWQFLVVNNAYDPTGVDQAVSGKYGHCNTTIGHTVNEPTKVTIGFDTPFHNGYAIKCNGASTGETTAIGSGGVGGYKDFSWSTGATTEKITGLKAGTYTVSLKDANNCVATNQVILQEPTPVKVSLSAATDYNGYPVSCWDKSDGGVKSTVSGGIAGYTYLWSTGASASSVSGLGVNTYSVTVTDGNSCKVSGSLALTAPVKIDFSIDQLAPLNCPGDKTAILEAKPVNATIIGAPHYNWSTGETSSTITDKGSGIYSLTLSDDQGCSTTKSITLNEPPAYKVAIVPQSNYNGSYIKCNGDANGMLAAVVKDGSNNIATAQNYLWTESGTTIGESASLSTLNNLDEGMYKVVITYGNQCKAEANYFLSDPDPVDLKLSVGSNYNGQAISCYNMTDGKLHAIGSGGTKSLSYSWNTGATGSLLSGIGAGSYTATVKDVNGCSATATMSLENPLPVQAVITDVSDYSGYGVSCYGLSDGSITSEGTGGTGVYTYTWSNGKTAASVNGLTAGSYTVTVSDNNGCKQSITQNITEPSLLTLSLTDQKNISCYDDANGSIQLSASGGAGGYTYSKDNKLSWQNTNSFTGLKAGSYTVVLHDNNGCEKSIVTTLTQPSKINIAFKDMQAAFCSNPTGMATAVVTGGVSGYSYSWQDSKNNIVDTDVTLSNVKGGIYTLIVTDNNTCTMNGSVGITSTDGAKSTYTATAAKCFDSSDGSASITITEGDGPFVIEWPDGQSTLQGINLKKGTYDVLITDSHNCPVVQTVEVTAPDALRLAVAQETVPTCNGVCDGAITFEATGGVGSYTYQWNNSTGATQSKLCAAVYPVVVKDFNGCVLTKDIELKHPEPLVITVVNTTLPTCKDGCDGSLEVAASGGNGTYIYTWATGGNTSIKSNICPGSYVVSVSDAKGCKGEGTVKLDNTPALPLNLGNGVTLCVGQTYTLDAGTGWKSIVWKSNTGYTSTDQKIVVKDAASYWLEVVNDKGCIAQDTFLLETSYDLLKASFMIPKQAIAGDTVVMIDISWPMPEKIEWNYPLDMTMLQDNGDILYGKFTSAGTYEVNLATHLGECYDQVSKTITIIESEGDFEGGRLGYEEYVKNFTLYPNPNNGAFHVGVELIDEMPITVSVWHSPSGILVRKIQQNDEKIYQLYFDLRPLTSGTYVLRLDYEMGKKYIRFVVN
jgi:hypothetical protein